VKLALYYQIYFKLYSEIYRGEDGSKQAMVAKESGILNNKPYFPHFKKETV
jgi:hypothetical protein